MEVVNWRPIVTLLVVVAINFKILGTRIAIFLLQLTWQTVRKSYRSVFLKHFYFTAPFSLSTRRFRPPSLMKRTQGSKCKELYLKKVLNS